ncbi:Protein of unknown function with HXXEE motif-containing protein [Clostridium acidisoli DSM 12555]|uniref:HXXEE domain-containing protein n=1 Tax=Clostridium acidisoli DSM 12555 TaxID=1121291 RepID=A0A1W1XR66_9CLOT|nr:HXXEE domain-containing protein [Clostridium acidisoli]SMC26352.1 Protein of unknown function with HXXEE motif-containing protein [Clostridium acidisoli DSM 12555]
MNNMNAIAWLLPIIFMIHDFEEIIFIKVWRKRYEHYLDNCTMKKKPYADFRSPDEFSIGVEILFVILSIISLFSVFFNNYYVWYGFLFTVIAHFVILHCKICLDFKHYVPGIVTAILFLPITIYIMYTATILLNFTAIEILLSCAGGAVFTFIIFGILKKSEKHFESFLIKYSNGQN